MEIDLFEQINISGENENNICSICYENLNVESSYTINECKHEFHSKCLLDWFRNSSNSSCPYCRNIIESKNNKNISSILFDMKIKFSKTKKAPKDFVILSKKYEIIKNKYKDIEKEYKKLWKKQRQFYNNIDKEKTYKEIEKEKKELKKQTQKMYEKRNKIRSKYFVIKYAIESVPIKPIIIKTKKVY